MSKVSAYTSASTPLTGNETIYLVQSGNSRKGTTSQFMFLAQNSQSADYTTVLSDAASHILHPSTDNNPRTFTIDSNAHVNYALGSCLTFVNEVNTVTIAITSDTMTLAGTGLTGSRTLSSSGIATAIKIGTTKWIISGTGLS